MGPKGFLGEFALPYLVAAALQVGCGGSSPEQSGGNSGAGNDPNTGGALSTGGSTASAAGGTATTASGGAPGTGGATSVGGNLSTGGSIGAGGNSAAIGTGGAEATGGSGPNGGTTGSGGANPTGGVGTKGTGGFTPNGGAPGSGGANPTGGSKATGGTTTISTGPVTTTCPGAAPAGMATAWCSCDQWGELKHGDATYYNDIWGSGAGPQCIWVSADYSAWGVAANHPGGGNVKSYPNISYSPGKVISSLNTYTSSYQITVPAGSVGNWEVAYDIWVQNSSGTQVEIMLWVNYTQGKVFPAGSLGVSNVNTGGSTWNVYYGAYGGHDVVSLLQTTNTTSGTLDVKAILNWIITNKGNFSSSWTLYQVQFGPEIVGDGGSVQSFNTNSFSVSSS